jgi:hypothetical protein
MIREAAPTGWRGQSQTFGDAAIQTCPAMRVLKVLLGMALRKTTGFVESLLCLIGPYWTVPYLSTFFSPSEDLGSQHTISWLQGPVAPVDLQHGNPGRVQRRMARPQA